VKKIKYYLVIIFLFSSGCIRKGKDKIFLLPADYVGYVVIIYDQPNGDLFNYENDNVLLKIPPNGILKTKLKPDYKRTSLPKFYYKSICNQNRIPLVINPIDYSEDEINASMPNIGKVYLDNMQLKPIEYSIFFIGTKEDIKRASKEVEKIKITELLY